MPPRASLFACPTVCFCRMNPFDIDNPFTGELAVRVQHMDFEDADFTLGLARTAARAWRSTSVAERIALCEKATAVMESRAKEIAADITMMMGKPLSQALGEVKGMATRARYMMSIAESSLADGTLPPLPGFERRIVKEPLGVVFNLPAWNYPLLTAVNAIIPGVVAGNAVIVKHSPRSPLCGEHFSEAFRAAGAPLGLVQHLHCDHPTSEKIVASSEIDHVVFTGSVYGGHRIEEAASKRFLHACLELGGNDPSYVAADADLAKTAENLVDGAIYNAGQSCCAVERVYVHRSVYAEIVERCEPLVRAYVMGDPMDDKTTLGPLAQPSHVAELEGFIADARDRGARIVAGGKRASVGGRGRFFEATLVADGTHAMKLFQGESFGPILPLCPVDSDEEALALMNDSRLGLTASIWTKDRERAAKMARALETGTVFMNRCDYLDPALPWVGVKDSGRGVSLSALGYDHLTRPKSVNFRLGF